MTKVLITGASGLIGSTLSELRPKIIPLCNSVDQNEKTKTLRLFGILRKMKSNQNAFDEVSTIVHLAGSNVGDKRWTSSWKKEILDSRIRSTRLLFDTIKKNNRSTTTFVSASAIGYYGFESDSVFEEESIPGKDFLAQVTKQWEHEVDKIQNVGNSYSENSHRDCSE